MTIEDKQKAVQIFEEHPQLSKLWMNPKGEFFTSENLAKNSLGKGETLECIDRVLEVESPATEQELTVDENIGQIEAEKAVSQVEQMLIDEQKGKNRAAIKKDAEKKISKLKKLNDDE